MFSGYYIRLGVSGYYEGEWRFDNTFLFSSLPVHHRHASVASIMHLSLSLSSQTKPPPPLSFEKRKYVAVTVAGECPSDMTLCVVLNFMSLVLH